MDRIRPTASAWPSGQKWTKIDWIELIGPKYTKLDGIDKNATLMWLNKSVATINAAFSVQLLDIL